MATSGKHDDPRKSDPCSGPLPARRWLGDFLFAGAKLFCDADGFA
jgi:hypothetical protein